MGSIKRAALATVAMVTLFVGLGPGGSSAGTTSQADGRTTTGEGSSDGGSPTNLLLAGGAVAGVGVLLFATHQPRPLTKRRRSTPT